MAVSYARRQYCLAKCLESDMITSYFGLSGIPNAVVSLANANNSQEDRHLSERMAP